jgi:hypothetical protein
LLTVEISGFTIVRNATRLDFPLEASLRSVLPVVNELIVNVGASEDDTAERVYAIGDPKLRVLQTTWDPRRGPAMLADETQRAMAGCRSPWGIYIQADEVFADGGAERVRAVIERCDADPRVEGILVDYQHFYGGFDTVARNRKWYRREVRAVRLGRDVDVRSFRDAQGFRVGPDQRHIRAVSSGAVMHHYGWARPDWALQAKWLENQSRHLGEGAPNDVLSRLPWIPGIEPFTGQHPAAMREWIAARRTAAPLIAPRRFDRQHVRLHASRLIERLTGWRPFEFRNYDEVRLEPVT